MNDVNPSQEQFFARIDHAFGFLAQEYFFASISMNVESESQAFIRRYENSTTSVVIRGEGWGFSATVSIGEKNARLEFDFEFVPLWALARLRGAGYEEALQVSGQLAQLEASAALLRDLAETALQGDFSAVESARAYLEDRVRKAALSRQT